MRSTEKRRTVCRTLVVTCVATILVALPLSLASAGPAPAASANLAPAVPLVDVGTVQPPALSEVAPEYRYFPETRHWVAHGFLNYWNRFGGLAAFGYPISEEFVANGVTVQYFERARFEWHPGAWPARFDVLLGR
ncbi:MAG TPA: hypothetical protein VMU89_00965, partial [Thermomicrobiaceae bacterium]|nr:hypothetical protein [Thermomicrobiaceae bacterium]